MDTKEQRRRRKRRRKALLLMMFVAFVLILSVCLGLIFKYKPTNEYYNTKQYFGLNDDSEVALVVNDELLETPAQLKDGVVYVSCGQVTEYINDRFYWDASLQKLLYTTPEGVKMHGEDDGGVWLKDGAVYVSLPVLTELTPMDCNVYNSPNRVVMHIGRESAQLADVKGTQAVRYRGGVKSPILTEVSDGSVTVLDAGDNWTKVATADGYIGYIQNKYLENERTEAYETGNRDEGYASLTDTRTINMAWHQVTNQEQNGDLASRLAQTQGVNVISPTWFYLTGESGDLASLANTSYVEYAHEQGVQVWALVDNFTETVDTNAILSNYESRRRVIDNLIESALAYGIDGINVDFEELTEETGAAYVQFIRELSLRCHDNQLVLSIDNHVPYDYNAFYGRSEQAVFADYIVLMSYDEHLNLSTGEGSVASIGYVRSAIERMLTEGVPASKLINGIPLYTRIWKEVPKTEEQLAAESNQNSAEEYIPYTLEWDTLGIKSAQDTLSERGVELTWSDEYGQYYGEYEVDGTLCKVWMEEEKSIEEKCKVMQEFGLIGIAEWKLGLEPASVWDVISQYYNGQ